MAPFLRSTSFSPPSSQKKVSSHIRSSSVPSQSHPFISNLEEQIRVVRLWAALPEGSSVWIEAGLAQIEQLLIALEDFLQLSQTEETLCQAASLNQLLEGSLQLVDTYGTFVSTILTIKECQSNIQSSYRRRDEVGMASSLRLQRKVEKEIAQLSSDLKAIKCWHLTLTSDPKEIEIAGIVMEAISGTAFASMAAFNAIGSLLAATSKKSSGTTRSIKQLVKGSSLVKSDISKKEDVDTNNKFERLDECIRNVECFSERVFRSLINSRVSLLNITTPCL